MMVCNQKVLVVILGLLISFTAHGAQIQSQATKSRNDDPSSVMLNKAREDKEEKEEEKKENEEEDKEDKEKEEKDKDEKETDEKDEQDEHDSDKANKNDLQKVKHELADNLHEQSELKHTIKDLTDEAGSDEEIDQAAKQVANQTDSVAMGDMLGDMWKDMRMLELPAYSKYVKKELHHLKHEEKKLEAKLTGKVSAEHDEDEKEEKEEEDEKDKEEEEGEDAKKTVKKAKFAWNFWRMSHEQQESVLMSSLVYVIGGLLAAVLFKQVREKYFVLEPMGEPHPSSKDFSYGIFGCLADMKLCALGFCCPCLAWANTLDRYKGLLSFWPAFLAFFGLLVLDTYTMGISAIFLIALGVYYRQKLRERHDIDSIYSGKKATLGMDIVFWFFCTPCAIIQEAREEGANQKRGAGEV